MIFSKDESYLKYASRMVAYNNAVGPLMSVKMLAQSMLQSLQRGPRATILSFLNNFMTIIVFNFVLYYTNPHDGARIIWCYPLAHVAACFISPFFLWGPLKNIWNLMKTEDKEAEYEHMNEEIEEQQQEAELENINMPRRTSVYDVIVKACDAVEDGTKSKKIDDELFNRIKSNKKKMKSHRTQGDIEKQKSEDEERKFVIPKSEDY